MCIVYSLPSVKSPFQTAINRITTFFYPATLELVKNVSEKNCYWRFYSRSSETTSDIAMVTKDKILTVNRAKTQKKNELLVKARGFGPMI